MRTRSLCHCLLCELELNLKQQLRELASQEDFSKVAASSLLLSGFPNSFALTAHLRSCRSNGNGAHPADGILLEILHLRQRNGSHTLLRDILLLAFIPVLHSAVRQLNRRYPLLSAEDAAQYLVASLLEAFDSQELLARNSHLAFAISRIKFPSYLDSLAASDAGLQQGVFGECGHCDGDRLEVLLAALRGDDDLLQVRGLVGRHVDGLSHGPIDA